MSLFRLLCNVALVAIHINVLQDALNLNRSDAIILCKEYISTCKEVPQTPPNSEAVSSGAHRSTNAVRTKYMVAVVGPLPRSNGTPSPMHPSSLQLITNSQNGTSARDTS
jgi:hypothetical protein